MQEEPAISGNTYEAPFAAVTTPIMADSDFVGWFTQIIGGTQVQPADIVTATADQTLYAQWAPLPTVTITFDGNGGTPTPLVVSGNVVGSSYASILASVTEPTQTGFVFQGWFDAQTGGTQITDLSNVPSIDTTLYAQWAPELPPPPPTITVTFDANGGAPATQTASVTVGGTYQSAFNVITTPTRAGHTFLGWFTNANGGTRVLASSLVTQTSDHTLYAHWTANQNPGFNDPVFRPPIFIDSGNREPEIQDPGFRQDVTLTEIHYSYLIGEGNNHIAPNDVITRAEVASILLRIVSDETRAAYWTLENPFSDVPNNGEAWFSNAISTANHKGIMTGFPDGTFRPNLPITRAEVVTVMTRFLHDEAQYRGTTDMFPYISDSWARNNINLAAQIGWIQGDQYGNFNPDANITRAEFATIVNRVLSRTATDIDTANMKTWIDNANTSAWFYWAMQIASNSSPQAPARNWAMLQLPNARAEDVII
ncbi:MAG: InlB B-repeat-containing protein [Oscillospiraceae bacterium]|nr:InlB B-repeat-containing protein [Oscillospiraceae bacterium]